RASRPPSRSAQAPPGSPRGRCRLPRSPRRSCTASLEARRAAAAHAIAPAHVHLAAAGRAAQLARGRLPALGAEVHFAAPGERLAAVGALARRLALLGQLERRARERRSFLPDIFVTPTPVISVIRRGLGGLRADEREGGGGGGGSVRAIAPQKSLGREAVEAQQGVGELAKQPRIGVLLPSLALQRLPDLRRLERGVAPLARHP